MAGAALVGPAAKVRGHETERAVEHAEQGRGRIGVNRPLNPVHPQLDRFVHASCPLLCTPWARNILRPCQRSLVVSPVADGAEQFPLKPSHTHGTIFLAMIAGWRASSSEAWALATAHGASPEGGEKGRAL